MVEERAHEWAKKPLAFRKSTAKLSHRATDPRLAQTSALARGESQSGIKCAALSSHPREAPKILLLLLLPLTKQFRIKNLNTFNYIC